MKTQSTILSLSLVVTVAYAGYLHFENAELREKLSEKSLVATEASAPSGVAKSPDEPEPDSRPPRAASVVGANGQGVPGSLPEANNNWPDRRRERMSRMAAAFDNPEMRVDMIERQMERIDSQFAGFFRTLDISPEELDTLRTLLAERGVIGWEARMRRFSSGSEEDRDVANLERDAQRDVISSQIEELLGKEATAELKDYGESLPYREEVESLATSLSFTKSPLNPEQSELLVQSIQSVSMDFEYTKDLSNIRGRDSREISAGEVATYFEERAQRDALIIESAAQALNEEQLNAFAERQIAERDREQRRMEFMLDGGGPMGTR